MFCGEPVGWHGATNMIAEAGGAGLALPGMKLLQGDIETAPSNYKGFFKRMDLGSLLRCSVGEKGQWTEIPLGGRGGVLDKENNFHKINYWRFSGLRRTPSTLTWLQMALLGRAGGCTGEPWGPWAAGMCSAMLARRAARCQPALTQQRCSHRQTRLKPHRSGEAFLITTSFLLHVMTEGRSASSKPALLRNTQHFGFKASGSPPK